MEGKPVLYERGEYLLHEGVWRNIYISGISGYCRYVTHRNDGSESVVGFSFPGDIASGVSDRMYRIPSRLTIIASCRLEVLQLPFGYTFSKVSEHDRHFTLKMEKAFL